MLCWLLLVLFDFVGFFVLLILLILIVNFVNCLLDFFVVVDFMLILIINFVNCLCFCFDVVSWFYVDFCCLILCLLFVCFCLVCWFYVDMLILFYIDSILTVGFDFVGCLVLFVNFMLNFDCWFCFLFVFVVVSSFYIDLLFDFRFIVRWFYGDCCFCLLTCC